MAIDKPTQTLSQAGEERAIRKLSEDWVAALKGKDIARLTDMVTEDAVFLPPGFAPIRGKQAVEAMYKSFLPQFSSVEQTVSIEESVRRMGFCMGTEEFVLVPQTGAPPIRMEGKGMSILRKQPGGTWRFARGINNTLARTTAR